MTTLTQQDIDDALEDMASLQKFVNDAAEDSPFTTRLGRVSKNLADLIAETSEITGDLIAPGIRAAFESSTTMGAPAAGGLRFNNATIASATAIAFSNRTVDSGNPDVSDFIATWGASSSAIRGSLIIKKIGAPEVFAEFNITAAVTDNTTWLQAMVAYVAGSGALTAADHVSVQWIRAGDKGDPGATGSSTGANVVAPQGRISLDATLSLTAADVTGAASVYYNFGGLGNIVPIWDGTAINLHTVTPLTLALDSNSGHTGYQQSGKNFDLFIIDDAGTVRLVSGPAWTSDTARGTGAGTTEIELKSGLWTNKNALAAARFGSSSGNTVAVAANKATLVGTIRMTADGVTEDSVSKRYVSNAYNAEARPARSSESTDSWTYSTAAYRQANNSAANQLDFVQTLAGHIVTARVVAIVAHSATNQNVTTAIGLDSSTAAAPGSQISLLVLNTASNAFLNQAQYSDCPGLGRHTLRWLEYGASSGTTSWYGDLGLPLIAQSGIWGEVVN